MKVDALCVVANITIIVNYFIYTNRNEKMRQTFIKKILSFYFFGDVKELLNRIILFDQFNLIRLLKTNKTLIKILYTRLYIHLEVVLDDLLVVMDIYMSLHY